LRRLILRNFKKLFEKEDERDWQEIMERETKERRYKKFKKGRWDFQHNDNKQGPKISC